MGVIEPTTMHGFKAIRPIWVSLDISRGNHSRAVEADSDVVGPREADSEGEAKDHKRQAQHGVEGGAPHRPEAFVAIQYEDAGKKPNLHLQTSQQQTRVQTGQMPRPLPKQPDIQTETTGEALRTTDQHHQTPRGRGTRGEGSRRRIPNKLGTKNRTRHRSKPTNKEGQGQAHPTTRRPNT